MENEISKTQSRWHVLFELGILIKGFNGIWETASGLLVLFIDRAVFGKTYFFLTRKELLEDPHDRLINFMTSVFQNVAGNAMIFAAVYILVHGVLNIFLAVQLYRNRIWAYLVTVSFTSLFICYQIYRIIVFHSLILAAVTIFDAIFIVFTLHEYRYQKNLAETRVL